MFKNYITTAWRHIKTHKAYAAINIFGLAVGIGAGLLIFIVVHYETSYEDFRVNKHNIYRVVSTYSNMATHEITRYESATTPTLSAALRNDIHSIKNVSQVWYIGGAQVHIPIPGKDLSEEKRVKQNDGLFFTEPHLFDIFACTWITGGPQRLNEPNTCVLNQSLANTFFGDWHKAMGQTLQIWSFRVPMQVVGVFEDMPEHTDLEIKLAGSFETFKKINSHRFERNDWGDAPWPSQCFAVLPDGEQSANVNAQLQQIVRKYYPVAEKGKPQIALSLQPLGKVHLDTRFGTYKGDALTSKELWSLGLIGFFLLLVACVNFINLATAQSVNRSREIGVRKVLGSSRAQILRQFLGETAVITTLSLLLGLALVEFALPLVSNLVGKPLSINVVESPVIILFLALLGIAVNFLAGLYPGMVLAGFNPVEAIKSKISSSRVGGISLRRGLVVVQFVIAQLLIICTVVVLQQMRFFRNQPMGFEKNAIGLIDLPSDSTDQQRLPYLKAQMLKIPGVEAATLTMDAPASYGTNNNPFYFNDNPVKKDFPINLQFADTGYLGTFRIGLISGRLPYASDTMRELLVNETLVRKLGVTDKDILGKTIRFEGTHAYPVVGVMQDFNSRSLKEPVGPMALASHVPAYGTMALRINPLKMKTALQSAQQVFAQTYPTYIYDLGFLDERITHFYTAESMAASLFKIAAFFAIFISCLGLYGLVSFMALQKTKEVGIRKVLGASIQSIVLLFSREFMVLIGIAFLIAAPLGYYLMQQWLGGFYNHIELGWLVFVLAILISVAIAWMTVGYKAIKAALANPVKSLRSE